MPLYRTSPEVDLSRAWILECDTTNLTLGTNLLFVKGPELEITSDLEERIERKWAEKTETARIQNVPLHNGNLARMNGLRFREEVVEIILSRSNYKEHHGTVPVEGVDDQWTRQHRPYNFQVIAPHVVLATIPKMDQLACSFAITVLVETSDNKIIYLMRGDNVDCYKNTWSVPCGGRISGDPHQVVDDLTSGDMAAYRHHTAGMLMLEFPGLNDIERRLEEVKIMAISRSLNDYDICVPTFVKLDVNFNELETAYLRGKYTGIGNVPATADGMIHLLQHEQRFPPTIVPIPMAIAAKYGIDPTEYLSHIEKL